MLIAQDLIWFRLICWSHRTSCSPHMLIAQDLIWFRLICWLHRTYSCYVCLDLPSTASLVEIWSSLGSFDSSEFIFFLSEGLSKAFIGCKTLLHSAFIFLDRKTYIWCSMSCNVWLCMNEMLMHWFPFYVVLQICHLLAHAYFAGLLVQSLSPLP